MKIYRSEYGNFYFSQNKENGWFSIGKRSYDNIDSVTLNPCMFRDEDEAWENGIEVPNDQYAYFNKFMQRNNNYNDLCSFIKKFYDVTQEELDNAFDHHPHLIELTKEISREHSKDKGFYAWVFDDLYQEVKQKYKLWNGDVKRIKAWIKDSSFINKVMYPDHTMIDIFGEMSQVKRNLIYDFFHDHVLTDEIVDEAEKLFPETVDYDKAYHYVKTKVQEAYDKERLLLAERRNLDAKKD